MFQNPRKTDDELPPEEDFGASEIMLGWLLIAAIAGLFLLAFYGIHKAYWS